MKIIIEEIQDIDDWEDQEIDEGDEFIDETDAFIIKLHKKCHYRVYLEKDKIIDKCSVCKLSIFASEELFECPICHRKAHLSHFLEWLKIKGYCPHCRTYFSSIEGVKKIEILNLACESQLAEIQMSKAITKSSQFIKEAKDLLGLNQINEGKIRIFVILLMCTSIIMGFFCLYFFDMGSFLGGLLSFVGFVTSLMLFLTYRFGIYSEIF